MINYFLPLHIYQTTTVMSMQDEGSLDSSSLKAFQNKCEFGCFCMLSFVEG